MLTEPRVPYEEPYRASFLKDESGANWLGGQIGPAACLIGKVLLEPSHVLSFSYCVGVMKAKQNSCDGDPRGSQSPEYFLSGS